MLLLNVKSVKIGWRTANAILSAFNDSIKEVLCFITQQEDWHWDRSDKNVAIYHRKWSDIIDLISDKEFNRSELAKEFIGYVTKGFNMRTQREILIQDVSAERGGINRFEEYRIYRNKTKPVAPQYFALIMQKSQSTLMVRAYRICQKYWGCCGLNLKNFPLIWMNLELTPMTPIAKPFWKNGVRVSKIPISPKKVRIIYWMSRLN